MWVTIIALVVCVAGAIVNSVLHGDGTITVALVGAIGVIVPAAIEARTAHVRRASAVEAHAATRRTSRGDIPIPESIRRAVDESLDEGPPTADLGPKLPPRDPPT
jgi:hypothetical protein